MRMGKQCVPGFPFPPSKAWERGYSYFLGHPRQISIRLTKVVIHRLNVLLKPSAPLDFSVMAEYQPEEIGTSEKSVRGVSNGDHTTTERYKRKIGDRNTVPST